VRVNPWFAPAGSAGSVPPLLNFSCEKCGRPYSIADEKVRGRSVRVRCKACQHLTVVEGPKPGEETQVFSPEPSERLRAAAAGASASPPELLPPAGASWFILVRGKQEGPFDELTLRELVVAGTINARTFLWQHGMPDWKRLGEVEALASLLRTPEPPPLEEALFADLDLPASPEPALAAPPVEPSSQALRAAAPVLEASSPQSSAPPAEEALEPARPPPWTLLLLAFVALLTAAVLIARS